MQSKQNKAMMIIFVLIGVTIIPAIAIAKSFSIKSWHYAIGEKNQDYESAIQLSYKPLQTTSNLHDLLPSKEGYIWVRRDFEIYNNFSHKSLMGLLIERLMIADETYCNGQLIGSSGKFPPNFFSEWNKVRLYTIPTGLLQKEKNTILIKIYVNNEGSIAGKTLIGSFNQLEREYNYLDFLNSRINAIISFLFFLVGCYYFLMFILRKKDKENLYFGLTCIVFSFYLFNFFITRIPGFTYELIPYLLFQKVIFILVFVIAYLLTQFLAKYLDIPQNKYLHYLLIAATIIPSLLLFWPSSYASFLTIRYKILILFLPIFVIYGIAITLISLFKHKKEAYILLLGSIPFYFCVFWDLIVHNLLKLDDAIYLMGFGFPSFLISIAVVLAVQTVQYHNEVEELNVSLEKKVEERTQQLFEANQELKLALAQIREQQEIARKDMLMAVNVQRSIIPQKPPVVENYDIGLFSMPMSGVSGDFYDFYVNNSVLLGLGLFDVSGHGISSGLLTIVSKSIIYRNFMNYCDVHLGKVMENINNELIKEFDKVDNYVTGILLRFDNDKVEYVNAAHADLLLRRNNSNSITVCVHKEKDIKGMFLGIEGMKSVFLPLQFTIKQNDVLLLYTDCLIEQKNSNAEEFGIERVKEAFLNARGNSAQQICDEIIDAFNQFKGDMDLTDDLTVIVLRKM
ncbi:MAG: SpoIIE family protein phosphatase [Spirochaetes bacterium]|nr:SpoIIE family protein phosphatase [Spirochaetota bacterium]